MTSEIPEQLHIYLHQSHPDHSGPKVHNNRQTLNQASGQRICNFHIGQSVHNAASDLMCGRENWHAVMKYFTREHDKHSHGLECTHFVHIPVRLTSGRWYLHPGMTSSLSPCSRGGAQSNFWIVKTSPSATKFSRRSMPRRTVRAERALGLDYELRMIWSFMRSWSTCIVRGMLRTLAQKQLQ